MSTIDNMSAKQRVNKLLKSIVGTRSRSQATSPDMVDTDDKCNQTAPDFKQKSRYAESIDFN